uniref:CCHC-type domain-containing protein n=1 Tax=Trichogramma kaykai TaxID=54128 RepID=A0ABD2VWW8_9HYME
MAGQTNITTPGGNPNNLVNPSVGSEQVKALLAFGCPSDSGEGTFSSAFLKQIEDSFKEPGEKDTQSMLNLERRHSISSTISDTSSVKRKRAEDDIGEVEPECDLYNLIEEEITEILKVFDLRAKKRPYSELLDEIPRRLVEIKRNALKLAMSNTLLKGRVSQSESDKAKMRATYQRSYKDVLKTTNSPKPKEVPTIRVNKPKTPQRVKPTQQRFVALIKSNDATTEPSSLKATLQSAINPIADKIHVKGLRQTRGGSLLIETGTKEDLTKLLDNQKLKDNGLSIKEPDKISPRMIVYDVPSSLSEEGLKKALREQNEWITPECLFQPKFRLGKKDGDNVHWVLEVSPAFRTLMNREKGVYLGWQRCRVRDYMSISRCFKCQGIKHIAKFCTETVETCGKCAETGHTQKNCPRTDRPKICALCKKMGRPHDHRMDNKCPAYLQAIEREKDRTDYGGG